jgi:hypothetical protein
MNYSSTMALVIFSTLFVACKREDGSPIGNDLIYTDYLLFYDENTNRTYANTGFKEGTSTGQGILLVGESKVSFNDEELVFQGKKGYYELAINGFVTSGTFNWKAPDGKDFINDVNIHELKMAAIPDSLLRTENHELKMDGAPLEENESLSVTIDGEGPLGDFIFTTTEKGSNRVILNKDQLSIMPEGPVTMRFTRNYRTPISQATKAGGVVYGIYRQANKIVYLK